MKHLTTALALLWASTSLAQLDTIQSGDKLYVSFDAESSSALLDTMWIDENRFVRATGPIGFDGTIHDSDTVGNKVYFEVIRENCGQFKVLFDGYAYATFQQGDQCWFAENLRSEVYANGDSVVGNLTGTDWALTTSGAQQVYEGDADNLLNYGRLYNWHAVNDARGLCPSGWHVPTDDEWTDLIDFLGGEASAGEALKASPDDDFSWDGTNASGFSGLPGGRVNVNGTFSQESSVGYWWTATNDGVSFAWSRGVESTYDSVARNTGNKVAGFSVRCAKDD